MKRILAYLFAITLGLVIFSGCKQFFPQNTDQFDLDDTVTVAIGYKVYENENLWIRLDEISFDSRCPEGWRCWMPGHVEGQFTAGVWGSREILKFRTDSVRSVNFMVPFDGVTGGYEYVLNIIKVSPQRPDFENAIPDSQYRIDCVLELGSIAKKPNIYLYPKRKTNMSVSLNFPQGGRVVKSDPAYPQEWQHISVTPKGLIDGKHEFLFYEASLPVKWQYDEGWSVPRADLERFFLKNLREYGFNDNEIMDFIDYWIPKLTVYTFYNIYPQHTQKINEVVSLHISKRPKSVLRMFYVIEPTMAMRAKDIPAPKIPSFERKGFTVAEWGVVFK